MKIFLYIFSTWKKFSTHSSFFANSYNQILKRYFIEWTSAFTSGAKIIHERLHIPLKSKSKLCTIQGLDFTNNMNALRSGDIKHKIYPFQLKFWLILGETGKQKLDRMVHLYLSLIQILVARTNPRTQKVSKIYLHFRIQIFLNSNPMIWQCLQENNIRLKGKLCPACSCPCLHPLPIHQALFQGFLCEYFYYFSLF